MCESCQYIITNEFIHHDKEFEDIPNLSCMNCDRIIVIHKYIPITNDDDDISIISTLQDTEDDDNDTLSMMTELTHNNSEIDELSLNYTEDEDE